jgi:hypothetical protein
MATREAAWLSKFVVYNARMPRSSLVYDVLIASPTDVADGRQVLSDVIRDWNSANFGNRGIMLRELRWELDSVPGEGPAQWNINKQLVDGADILLGLFWTRLGSPTRSGLSGTVEEITRSRARGKQVLLYFSEAPIPWRHDAEQLRLLREYRESLKDELYYWPFSALEELRRFATTHLANTMNKLSSGSGGVISSPENGAIMEREVEVSGTLGCLKPGEIPWLLVEIESGHVYPQTPLKSDSHEWRGSVTIGSKPGTSKGETFVIKLVAASRKSNYEFEKYDRKEGDRASRLPSNWPSDFRTLATVSVIRRD